MRTRRAVVAMVVGLMGLTAGCGSDGSAPSAGASGAAGGPGSSPSSATADLCDLVSAAQLSNWTGTDAKPVASDDPGFTCTSSSSSELLSVSWRLTDRVDSLEQVASDLRLELPLHPVRLPGDVEAWLITGDLMDQRLARVVTLTADHTLMVDAMASRLADGTRGLGRLSRLAQEVAAAYVS